MVVYGFRGMETESISEVLYFGTRRPFHFEGVETGNRYVCMQCELLAVEVCSNVFVNRLK